MTKVLYVAGYGRSGSTVLDILLSNHTSIAGIGEATFLLDEWDAPNRRCSCGHRYADCEFWGDLFRGRTHAPALARTVRGIERQAGLLRLLRDSVSEAELATYREYQAMVFDYVAARTQAAIVVDSSKSARDAAGRFYALAHLAGQEVYVLHLVRNGIATMESLVRTGSNWALEGYIPPPRYAAARAAVGWVTANLVTMLLGRRLGPDRYMFIRYEDFIATPAAALYDIGQFCGFDPKPLIGRIERNDSFAVGHQIGGNRTRLSGEITLRRRPTMHAGETLSTVQRMLFLVIGGMLNRRYGYR